MVNFNVGDKVRRPSRRWGWRSDDQSVRVVTEVFDGGWFNHADSRDTGEYSHDGGCSSQYWELVEKTALSPEADFNSRSNDPATSKAAGKVKRVSLRLEVALTVVTHNYGRRGWTGKELAEFLDRPLNSVTPRLAELRREGRIEDSGERRDKQIVWRGRWWGPA